MSKKQRKSKVHNPQHISTKPLQPQRTSPQESEQWKREPLVPDVAPAPYDTKNPENGGKQKLTGWKITKRTLQILGFLTLLAYTIFAGLQSCSMNQSVRLAQRQITDSESQQAAQLVVEDYKAEWVVGSNVDTVRLTYKLHNVGQTTASQIGIHDIVWTQVNPVIKGKKSDTDPNFPIDPNGFSLPAGVARPFTVEQPVNGLSRSDSTQMFGVSVKYLDIFGQHKRTGDCLYHVPHSDDFYPCTYTGQEEK
jgi:hypothetical protein